MWLRIRTLYTYTHTHTCTLLHEAVIADQSDVEKHLEQGKKFLQEGQLQDALQQYTAAVGMEHELIYLISMLVSR